MSNLKELSMQATVLAQSPRGRRWIQVGRVAFVLGVVAWLVYKLYGIGWREVWIARPRTPWFYVIWLGLYLQLPLVEALIYRAVWKLPVRLGLLPLLHKRTLNQDVVSTLGEAYLFMWSRHRVTLSDEQIAGTLKDNLIASSLASWTAIALLILLSGPTLLDRFLAASDPLYTTGGAVLMTLAIVLGVWFRRTIFTLPLRTVFVLFTAHLVRFMLLVFMLQILQWWVVLPDAPLSLWAKMLVVVTVVNRVPFMPTKDLIGIGAILGIMALPTTFEATVAAMLLIRSVLDRTFNLAFLAAHSVFDRKQPRLFQIAD